MVRISAINWHILIVIFTLFFFLIKTTLTCSVLKNTFKKILLVFFFLYNKPAL